jgi:hypothetical protein
LYSVVLIFIDIVSQIHFNCLIHFSLCSSVCKWYAVNILCFISSSAVSVFQNLLVNSLSLLMINFFNSSWLLINSCSIMYVNTDAVAVFLNEINIVYLINLFTIINMLSNFIFHAEFFDDELHYEVHNNWLSWFTQCINLCYFIILFISLNLVSLTWITLSDVFCNSISKIADIASSLYEILIHLTSRCSSALLLWHFYINSLFIKKHSSLCMLLLIFCENSFLCSEFQCKFISLLMISHLLKVSASSFSLFFCNEFEIQSLLTTQFSESVTDSAFVVAKFLKFLWSIKICIDF